MSMSIAVGAYWETSAWVTSTARCHASVSFFDHRRVTAFNAPVRVKGSCQDARCLAGSTSGSRGTSSDGGAGDKGLVLVWRPDLVPAAVVALSEGESSIMAWREGKDQYSFDAEALMPGEAWPPLGTVKGDLPAQPVLGEAARDVAGLADVDDLPREIPQHVDATCNRTGRQR